MLFLSLATLLVLAVWLLLTPNRPGLLILTLWTGLLCTTIPYSLSNATPSGLQNLCLRLWLGLAVVWWVARDRRQVQYSVPFEYDAFMLAAWPVLLPHYLVRTRGRAGAMLSFWLYAPVLGFGGLYALLHALGVQSFQ